MRYIAYFDYLGFKSFIENNTLEFQKQIMSNNFRDMGNALGQEKYHEVKGGVVSDLSAIRISCINFSDTVVFYSNDDSWESLQEILKVAYDFNWRANIFCFPVRGCLVFGELEKVEFKTTNSFGGSFNINSVYGRGLVTAHGIAEDQNWAGSVLDQSFVNEIIRHGEDVNAVLDPFAVRYTVPYKTLTGRNDEYVLRLTKPEIPRQYFDNVSKTLAANFSQYSKPIVPSVEEKIKNTLEFLESGVKD